VRNLLPVSQSLLEKAIDRLQDREAQGYQIRPTEFSNLAALALRLECVKRGILTAGGSPNGQNLTEQPETAISDDETNETTCETIQPVKAPERAVSVGNSPSVDNP
jgi:hypothetical protein